MPETKSSEEISGEIVALLDAFGTLVHVLNRRFPGLSSQFITVLDDPQASPESVSEPINESPDFREGFHRIRNSLIAIRGQRGS